MSSGSERSGKINIKNGRSRALRMKIIFEARLRFVYGSRHQQNV